jgi:hypothetical protein
MRSALGATHAAAFLPCIADFDACLIPIDRPLQGRDAKTPGLPPARAHHGAPVTPRPAEMPIHAFACKECPRLTRHGHGRASLLRREPADVFYKTAPDQPHIGDSMVGARNARTVTSTARSPVSPAMGWMRVVSMASARVIGGRNGGESPRQHRLARPRGAEEQIMVRTPTSPSAVR